MEKNSSISIYDSTNLDVIFLNKQRTIIISRIKNSYDWLENVKSQAKKREITLDSMLILSANYVIETAESGCIKERAVLIHKIKNDEEWLNSIIEDAKVKNIQIDSMILKNVNHILYTRQNK